MAATQTGRVLQVTTPLGKDALLLTSFTGHDGLSQLFSYKLEMLSDKDQSADFSKLLGQSITVRLEQKPPATYFNGIVSRFAQLDDIAGAQTTYRRYVAEVVPSLWLLTRQTHTRLFSQKTVVDIAKEVLTGIKTDWKVQGAFPKRDYCVQYQETDFAFLSRLFEEEGIYYFFTHADGAHSMVLGNTPDAHAKVENSLTYRGEREAKEYEDSVFRWEKIQEVRAGKFSLREHQFEVPDNSFDANYPVLNSVAYGTVTHKLGLGANSNLEIYEYPARFGHHYDVVDPSGGHQPPPNDLNNDPARLARLRMEQETMPGVLVRGHCTSSSLRSGYTFNVAGHPHANGAYVATRAEHSVTLGDGYLMGEDRGESYVVRVECIPKALPFRPARVTPRPIIHGTQTAVVVGDQGNQKIFTDKYGRVKVKFHWDKQSKQSCWVRVATLWSDQNWGSQFIPRDGQEVVIAFEEGDPDKPMVVGCVYNDKNMPPFALPDNATQSGIKSYCGAQDKFNLLRFEDKTDNEEIWLHAQKNYVREVLNNETTVVGVDGKADDGSQSITILQNRTVEVTKGDETFTIKEGSRTHTVHKDETLTVETGNRSVTISEGNETLEVTKGNRSVTIAAGNETLDVTKGNRTVTVAAGNETLNVTKGNRSVSVGAGTDTLEAATSITLKVGSCSIEITTSGITIKAPQITIQASGSATVDGGGSLALKGGSVAIN